MKGLNVIYDWKRVLIQFNTALWVMKINLPILLINKVNYYKHMFPLILLQ